MNTFLLVAAAAPITAALAGCAIVSSERIDPSGNRGEGTAYALPMARVPVVLSANAGQIVLRLGAPVTFADPNHHYIAKRVSNPFSADQVTIKVDPNTSFLTAVSAVGKDETLAVLEKGLLPKSAPVAEAFEATGEEIDRAEVDPADPTELEQASATLSQALGSFLDAQVSACTEAPKVCAEYERLRRRAPTIRLSGRRPGPPVDPQPTTASSPPADCGVGVCYRQPLPFVLKASLGGTVRSVIVSIPNASPVIAVPLERHAFVTTTHTLAFEQGQLTSSTVDRPSSALALVSSPLAAVSGVIASVTKPLSELLKIDTSGQYQAKADEAKTKADTAKEKAEAKDKDDAGGAPTPTLLATLTLGNSQAVDGLVAPAPAAVPAAKAANAGAVKLPGSSGSAPK